MMKRLNDLKQTLIAGLENYPTENIWGRQQAYGLALVSLGGGILIIMSFMSQGLNLTLGVLLLGFGLVYRLTRQGYLISAANLMLFLLILLAGFDSSPFARGAILLYATMLAATYIPLAGGVAFTVVSVALAWLISPGAITWGYTGGFFLWVAITSGIIFRRLKQVAYEQSDYIKLQETQHQLNQQLLAQQTDYLASFDLLEKFHRVVAQIDSLEVFLDQVVTYLQYELALEHVILFRYYHHTQRLDLIQAAPTDSQSLNMSRLYEVVKYKRFMMNQAENDPASPLTLIWPLIYSGEVIAVVELQGQESAQFNPNRWQVLEVLMQQISRELGHYLALHNLKTALHQTEDLNRRLIQENWEQTLENKTIAGYVYRNQQSQPTEHEWLKSMTQIIQPKTGLTLSGEVALPLKLRGELIGVLGLQRSPDQPWTEDEQVALQTISEQIGLALESARLFEDTQRNAWRDQMISETTAKVWASNQIEQVMQAAVSQLANKLGAVEVTLQLQPPSLTGTATGVSKDSESS